MNLLPRDAAVLLLDSSKSCSLMGKKENASLLGAISFVVLQKVIKSTWCWSLLGHT